MPANPPSKKGVEAEAKGARLGRAAWLWIGALGLALLLLGGDSARRLEAIQTATDARLGSQPDPELDPDSPSGYRWNQHRLLLTQVDGYQWLLQAEQATRRDELRVRATDYDNAPVGREVHWAGPMRWWTQGLARAYRVASRELTPAEALERVAPWANAALLAAFLLVLTPLMALRFGPVPAALFAVGSVTIAPLYDLFAVGYVDHHGLAVMWCMVALLGMVGGGGGWIRNELESVRPRPDERALWSLVPTRRVARWLFACSGVAGAVGIWISAATTVPMLMGLGVGALVSARLPTSASDRSVWLFEPSGFRVWGVAGAAASFCLYLVEYFPGDLGMRLEVNHPLYALALVGAGDFLARVAAPRGETGSDRTTPWLLADVALVLALPVIVLLTGESTFRIADPFLWVLHDRYIDEFLDLRTWMLARPPATVAAELSLVPLVALPLAGILWSTALQGWWRIGWRALLLVLVGAGAAYAYVFLVSVTGGNEAIALLGAAGATALWFAWPALRETQELPPPARSIAIIGALPGFALLVMALLQLRWLGIAAGLGLVTLVTAVSVMLAVSHPLLRTTSGRLAGGALLLLVLAPPVMLAAERPVAPANIDAIARDASYWLRRRLGDQPGVVLASPTATTHMIWFGGFRGVGTLYWENLEGLRASAEIYGAADPDSARALLTRHDVTHLAFYAWDGGLEQLSASAGGDVEGVGPEDARGLLHRLDLELRLGRQPTLPPWLAPLPYIPPRVSGYNHPIVQILEVVDEMPREIALVRLARYYQALGDERMDQALGTSLEVAPSVPGLAMLAQLERLRGDGPGLLRALGRLRLQLADAPPIDLEDRFEVAIAFGLAGDREETSRQLRVVLAEADEAQLRRLRPERLSILVDLIRDLGLNGEYPEALALALRLTETP